MTEKEPSNHFPHTSSAITPLMLLQGMAGIVRMPAWQQIVTVDHFQNPVFNGSNKTFDVQPDVPDTRAQYHKAMDLEINLMVVDLDKQDSGDKEDRKINKQALLGRLKEKAQEPGEKGFAASRVLEFVQQIDTMQSAPDMIDVKTMSAALHQVLDSMAEDQYLSRHKDEKAQPYEAPEKLDFENVPDSSHVAPAPKTPAPKPHGKKSKQAPSPEQPHYFRRGSGAIMT